MMDSICREAGVTGLLSADEGVEITRRVGEKGTVFFVINNRQTEAGVDFGARCFTNLLKGGTISGKQRIAPRDVWVLKPADEGEKLENS